ncbi:LysR substrate-binding domain-containing protein [Rhodoferax sp.]|uniref:LysR substrate-binding domain-containing protein n=1 Tax=Rhodoferax sp. TaxID=50421 RepID=UPI002841E09B|nr:LysR substrate-binding domain-containing protein [Rhodoferax sp.]MDR3371063.1 LysR substrate-binding domain-containing protein [Rhodoferax sp.]
MVYRLPALSTFRTFEAVVRHLSFTGAAQELNVTPAAVSQQMKKLESYLGVALFLRTPNSLQLTDDGLAMYPKIRDGLDSFAAGVETTQHHKRWSLNVTAPPAFASRWLISRLTRFSVAHPDVLIRITSDIGNIDDPDNVLEQSKALIDPRSETSEVAIRFGTGLYPAYQVEKLITPDFVVACSPHLCTSDLPLQQPQDLSRHILIHDESTLVVERMPNWQTWLTLAGVNGIDVERGLRFSNAILTLEAALDGQGVAFVQKQLIEADIAAGRLLIPFATSLPSHYSYFLVVSKTATTQAVVLAFQQWLKEEIGQRPQ